MENPLYHTAGRVVVSVDLEGKNSHRFSDGTTIRLERQYNNFNRRETEPVNATVISGDDIPSGAEILISHNALHDVNRIFDYGTLSGTAEASSVKYYSLPISDCFAWRDSDGDLQPLNGYAFGLRVYKPYAGVLTGIEPEVIKNVLLITTGDLCGNICHVLKASDYEIIYQGTRGREERVIRLRHSDSEVIDREEIVAVSGHLTGLFKKGKLLAGLSPGDAVPISQKV